MKRMNFNWSFTNEPEVRFRFWILVKVGPTIRPAHNAFKTASNASVLAVVFFR